MDNNAPQILVEKLINSILKPRVFLVQVNNSLVYQSLAIKYDMGFVNLNRIRLRDCLPYVAKCQKRDIILCSHGHEKKRMVSEDLYWIEKNIGDIRYVGNCKHEDKNVHEEKMVLEKPQPPQKPKPAEGEEPPAEEQPPAEDPPADGEQKKGLDIF